MAKTKTIVKTKAKTNKEQVVLFPGSFDPLTKGHLDVIKRLSKIFDRVCVLVTDSTRKNYFFSKDERLEIVKDSIKSLKNVDVTISSKLTVEVAKSVGAKIIARSVRTVGDWEYEYAMSFANKKMAPEIETFFIMADASLGFISSSLVREVAQYGGDISAFVPENVIRFFKNKRKAK